MRRIFWGNDEKPHISEARDVGHPHDLIHSSSSRSAVVSDGEGH